MNLSQQPRASQAIICPDNSKKDFSDLVQNQESNYLKNPPSEGCGPLFTPIVFFLLFGHFSGRLVSPTVANFFFLLRDAFKNVLAEFVR